MVEPTGFRCQSCKARLVLVRGSQDGTGTQDRRSEPGGLLAGLECKIEESFIVLDDRKAAGTFLVNYIQVLQQALTALG